MADQRALSVRQPWAEAILRGKFIENRSKPLPRWMLDQIEREGGVRVWLHASKGGTLTEALDDRFWIEDLEEDGLVELDGILPADVKLTRGAIVGEMTIVGQVTEHDSAWFAGPYGYLLADVVRLVEPVRCRGMLGFFRPEVVPS